MDALTDILKSVQLEGAIYLNARFQAPWAVRGKYGLVSLSKRKAGIEHVLQFHFIVDGQCKIRLADSVEVTELQAGDLVLFPHDDRHVMGSDLHLAPTEAENLNCDGLYGGDDVIHVRGGGDGEATRLVCGYLACSRSMARPLLDALPRIVRIPIGDGEGALLVRELLRVGVRETVASRPGAEHVLAKLAEILFGEALRRHAASLPADGRGLFAALKDSHVGKTLALMHGQPHHPWTVEEFAQRVALSRSALSKRFAQLVGETPMQYLTRWRLALAARELRSSDQAIVRIADEAGYESEAAFNRAFKREFGLPPAAWRRAAGRPTAH